MLHLAPGYPTVGLSFYTESKSEPYPFTICCPFRAYSVGTACCFSGVVWIAPVGGRLGAFVLVRSTSVWSCEAPFLVSIPFHSKSMCFFEKDCVNASELSGVHVARSYRARGESFYGHELLAWICFM